MDELVSLFQSNPQGFASAVQYTQGTLRSWDPVSGANIVELPGGTQLRNLKILNASVFTILTVGDSLALLLINNQYTIAGKVKSAGNGLEAVKTAFVSTKEDTTSTSPANLTTVGPSVTTYIGASRTALILMSARIYALNQQGQAVFDVTGASAISATWPSGITYGPASTASAYSMVTATAQHLYTPADGLNQGMNTFTMKYLSSGGQVVSFESRRITVIPF